ncbi:MAG: hypothetical protein ACPH3N_05605 [Alcanivorax sediminis]|nr:hypothetical protein [Alcanivorax sediminis]
MTTTIKDMLNALATLLGAATYNGCLDARKPVPVPVPINQAQPRLPVRHR